MSFFEWLSSNSDIGVILAATVPACLFGIIAVLAAVWSASRKAEFEASLKLEMINRGMSAEDIDRVLKASLSGTSPKCCADKPAANVAAEYKAQVVRS